jgi:hypothetical protein
MLDQPAEAGPKVAVDDLLRQCEEIASASGGVLGFRRISSDERALIRQIEATLKAR